MSDVEIKGEWLAREHGLRSRRRWRKLHLGLDTATQEIAAEELTPDDVGDVSVPPGLLDQIDGDVASVTADNAYDGKLLTALLPIGIHQLRSSLHSG